ncbi:hypothetical protein GA0074692_2601 [Micromonospora pallida]|uniref:Integral membrane protein n=1 Tax=Micromonospora pallida TaxID=145854 RepID=A0A1C6SH41_9ACTN|nr:hypothetical protein [Micromonospora pallida]SCL28763.1 hypothetical protein GA0074692_2601 [Micromonospora pallida]
MAHEVVELRVHGVSGATAETLLDHPVVIRVAGDDNAGFYRPRPGFGPDGSSGGVRTEAYRWGSLTAGAAVRTVSLLFLLPFMLVNLAVWTRPATGGAGGIIGPLCRLLAATLTAAYVLSVVGATVDIVGWQCVPYRSCTHGRGYLSWLGKLPLSPRLALLALLPIGALRLLWWLGERSARAFEAFSGTGGQGNAGGGEDRIDRPGFWNDALVVQWLRAIHVAVGLGVLAAILLGAQIDIHPTPVAYVLFVAVWFQLAACVVLLCVPARHARKGPGRGLVDMRGVRTLRRVAIGLTLLALGSTALPSPPDPPRGQLPGYEGAVAALIGVQAGLLVVLVVTTLHQRRRSRTAATSWLGGLATPVFAAAAVAASYGFAAALVYRVADLLDRGVDPEPGAAQPRRRTAAGAPRFLSLGSARRTGRCPDRLRGHALAEPDDPTAAPPPGRQDRRAGLSRPAAGRRAPARHRAGGGRPGRGSPSSSDRSSPRSWCCRCWA